MAQCGFFMNIPQAKGFCKELLAAEEYADGQRLERFDRMRLKTILDFAQGEGYGRVGDYPDSPIADFSVDGRRFLAHFEDGREVVFYWQKLFSRPDGKDTALAAMRAEVAKDTRAWLRKNPDCLLCGDQAGQVDHIQPFADIALSWLVAEGLDWDDVRTKVLHKPGFYRRMFVDADLRKSWIAWHESRAVLRSLCVPCHQKRGNNAVARQLVA